MNHKHVQAAANSVARVPQPDDSAFETLAADISVYVACVDTYAKHGGTILPRHILIDRLVNNFGDDILVLR